MDLLRLPENIHYRLTGTFRVHYFVSLLTKHGVPLDVDVQMFDPVIYIGYDIVQTKFEMTSE
jgi:hypothetical protein